MDVFKARHKLGIGTDEDVIQEDLRKRFLRAALKVHPDKYQIDSEKKKAHIEFTELKEAYDLLTERAMSQEAEQKERDQIETLLGIYRRALSGENVEDDLKKMRAYIPPDMFGVDLSVPFDSRLNFDQTESDVDPEEALNQALFDDGLDPEGNPLDGWARPHEVDLEDL